MNKMILKLELMLFFYDLAVNIIMMGMDNKHHYLQSVSKIC